MERAIIHSDLRKKEIQPKLLLDKYLELVRKDIEKLLPIESLNNATCPVTGEKTVRESFQKMGMHYNVSQSHGNVYLSPRPSMETLRNFYNKSLSWKFWLTKLWPQTFEVRQEKIILPQLEWALAFISQYSSKNELLFAEYLPNHWGYYNIAKKLFTHSNYSLVEPLFNPFLAKANVSEIDLTNEASEGSLDVIFLFEAIDRSVTPLELLHNVAKTLKPKGLCFITSLLSSGFEVQVLQEESEIFVPPERMNLLTFEGMKDLINKLNCFEVLEFSTPGVLDIPNVIKHLDGVNNCKFFNYIFKERQDSELLVSFQDFLQINCLGTFGRLVLRKQ